MRFWLIRLGSIVLAILACLLLQEIVTAPGFNEYTRRLIVLAGLYVTLSVSLNLINGITGQFSIGHAAFYQVGAYLAGYLTVTYYGEAGPTGLPWFLLMLFVGAAGAAIAGLIVGLPSLRLRGDYLAIVTLGFGEIIRIVVQNTEEVGGSYGLSVEPKFQAVWLIWLLAILCIAVSRNLLKTAHGLPYLSVREDEVASSAMGVNVTKVKVSAFIIGSAFAGAAGSLLAHYEGFITPSTFGMDVSFIILTMVVLGGTGSITGSALAAVFLAYLPEYLRGLKGADGAPLTMPSSTVVAILFGIVVAVALIKRVMDHYHGAKIKKAGFYAGTVLGGIMAMLILSFALGKVPALAQKSIEAANLRMVIFAVALIVLMLLRPQGVFGHHEFSWSWVKSLFTRRPVPHTAVSS